MNQDYLLKMKHENDYITAYLNEIKEVYIKMKEETIYHLIDTSLNVNEETVQYNKNTNEIDTLLNQLNEHLIKIILLNKKINNKLIDICRHDMVTDLIDIDLDTSKTIEYCKNCGFTKK
jgi:hypothetical protein